LRNRTRGLPTGHDPATDPPGKPEARDPRHQIFNQATGPITPERSLDGAQLLRGHRCIDQGPATTQRPPLRSPAAIRIAGRDNGSIPGRDNGSIPGRNNGSIRGRNDGSILSRNNGSILSRNNGSLPGRDHGSLLWRFQQIVQKPLDHPKKALDRLPGGSKLEGIQLQYRVARTFCLLKKMPNLFLGCTRARPRQEKRRARNCGDKASCHRAGILRWPHAQGESRACHNKLKVLNCLAENPEVRVCSRIGDCHAHRLSDEFSDALPHR